nr:hypothetical protein [uncultured Pseudodesulfovibrio sp.]
MKLNTLGKICIAGIMVLAFIGFCGWQESQKKDEEKRTFTDFHIEKQLILKKMNELTSVKEFNKAIALGYKQQKFDDPEVKNAIERIITERKTWLEKALPTIKAEKQVRTAWWAMLAPEYGSKPYLAVSMNNDGSDRSGYAEYLCVTLADVGIKGVDIIVKDHSGLMHNTDKTIGSAYCPE